MDATEMVDRTRDSLTAGRIFGEPVRQGGVTVIPVARLSGGGGSGGGRSVARPGRNGTPGAPVTGTGSGGGFGLGVTPAGAFVLRDGDVTWRPAVDVNRIVAGVLFVVVVALLVLRGRLPHRAGEQR